MPVSFLTDSERERLQRFPAEISFDDITAFFTLSEPDIDLVCRQRGNHNRIGFTLQLCTLRYLAFCPKEMSFSDKVTDYVAKQLGFEPSVLEFYGGRQQTQSDPLQEIVEYLGFRIASTEE